MADTTGNDASKAAPADVVQLATPDNQAVIAVRAPFVTQLLRGGFVMSIVAVVLGVALHIAEYAQDANSSGYLPPGSGMGGLEIGGMVLVTCGVVAAAVFMFSLHDVAALHRAPKKVVFTPAYFDLLQNASWTWVHTKICLVLLLAVTIDMMKPPTISFIMPGLLAEYKLTKQQGSVLPTVAISGTTLGSILWGFMSDRVGRRYAILLSTVLFVATSICGAMPNFASNVFMCWLMGVSVGGLIPVAVSLLSEVVPSRIRTKALISVLSAGSAFGYLAASGFSYLLQTWFAWRTLWFVGLPTGLLMLPLSLGIPESFRFLVLAGRLDEACQSMSLYFGIPCTPDTLREFFSQSEPLAEEPNRRTSNGGSGVVPGAAGADVEMTPVGGAAAGAGSARGGEAEAEAEAKATRDFWKKTVPLIASLSFLALAWGIIQYGFVNYVPTMLGGVNVIKTQQANSLIFYSSAASCAFVPVYIYLYGFFSSKWALTIMASWELVMFVAFGASYTTILSNATAFSVWYTFFLGAHNAVYAMITVYSAENFSTKVRGRGTGMISAASRVSGVFAPYSIATILTVGKPWQMSLCVGLPLLVGTVLFAVFSQETANYEVDNVLVFSPVAPLYEEHEVLLDPRTTAPDGGAPGAHQDRGEGDVAV